MPDPAAEWRQLYEGRVFKLAQRRSTLADGKTHTWDVVVHPGSVVVLAMPDDDHVCLIRNHRWVIGQTLYELPAGTLDPGEDPDDCARRELHEETGYVGGRWRRLLEFYSAPGFLTERMHLYLAEEVTAGPAKLEPYENITTEVVPWSRAMQMVADRAIIDAKTLVGLMLFDGIRFGRLALTEH